MYSIHPIVSNRLVEDRYRELRRNAGQTRTRRQSTGRRVRGGRGG